MFIECFQSHHLSNKLVGPILQPITICYHFHICCFHFLLLLLFSVLYGTA